MEKSTALVSSGNCHKVSNYELQAISCSEASRPSEMRQQTNAMINSNKHSLCSCSFRNNQKMSATMQFSKFLRKKHSPAASRHLALHFIAPCDFHLMYMAAGGLSTNISTRLHFDGFQLDSDQDQLKGS